jgi:hypothetical protein
MFAATQVMRATLHEIAGWFAALVVAYQLSSLWPQSNSTLMVAVLMAIRMWVARYEDWRRLTATERETDAYLDESEGL